MDTGRGLTPTLFPVHYWCAQLVIEEGARGAWKVSRVDPRMFVGGEKRRGDVGGVSTSEITGVICILIRHLHY